MDKVTLIKNARDILSDPNQWIKGEMLNENGCCIIGALKTADTSYFQVDRYEAERELQCHLPGGAEAFMRGSLVPLAQFNDDPETTHQDVLNLFDKALADLGGLA